jgi:type I restriction enzyme M protein
LTDIGGSAGNGRLLADLGWQEHTYVRVRDELVEEVLIVRGRGRGGSAALAGSATHEQPMEWKPAPRTASKGKVRSAGSFEQTFNALDKVLRNEAGQTTELDYTEQS